MKLKNIKANYTMVPNQWFRAGLSLKAIGLITLLQSLPDNWDFSVAGLMALTQDGKASIQSALWELERAGFIVRHQETENGRFSHNVIELQIGRKTVDGKSADGKPVDGKSTTINNINIKERLIKERESARAPEAYELADLLHQKILGNKPNRIISSNWRESWAAEIDKMHRLDKREWEQIRAIIEWSQDDTFWWKNILSGRTLREKFDRLEDDMNALKGKQNQVVYLS